MDSLENSESQKSYAKISDEKLKVLAKDPKNLVYHWKDREKLSENEIVPLAEVKDKVARLYALFTELRQAFVKKNISIRRKQWDYIKSKIKSDPEWKRFSFTHPLIYDRIVNPETTEKEVQAIMFMINLREKQNTGSISDGKERLAKHVMDQFSMTPEEWERVKERDGIKSETINLEKDSTA